MLPPSWLYITAQCQIVGLRQRGPRRFRNDEIADYVAERETFWTSNPLDYTIEPLTKRRIKKPIFACNFLYFLNFCMSPLR